MNVHLSNPDPIRIDPNPLPEVALIWVDLYQAIVHCTRGLKRRGIHERVKYINSEWASPGYTQCSTYLLISRSNMKAGWTDEGAMIAV